LYNKERNSMTVQKIAKELVKAGLEKAATKRENFKTVAVGNYEARHLKFKGFSCIIVEPRNGMTCEKIQSILAGYETEVKNGIVIVKSEKGKM
jgi:hypothetical protein